jgi:hypothetical protein
MYSGDSDIRYLFAFPTKDEMDKWQTLLATSQLNHVSLTGKSAYFSSAARTTEGSDAAMSVGNLSGMLWIMGQCVSSACGASHLCNLY